MLFSSPYYLFAFLPLVWLGYFFLNRWRFESAGKIWLVLASLYFYGFWNPAYLALIIASIVVNFGLGNALHKTKLTETPPRISRKSLLVLGIVFNLGILGYYKYTDFLIANMNVVFGSNFPVLDLLLPLAISFFTFQQVAYLVDCYQYDTQEYDFLSYCLFVSFFPQLIAGPIVHHKEMMPQFSERENRTINVDHLAQGVLIFCIGLFKKVAIADSFGVWADAGYADVETLSFFSAWGTSLSYTLQLYYDFSGYSDMAIGAALMFNIRLPVNFNSPYKSANIQDFWRRWHMTLSRWLRDYLYIPLGGNRRGTGRVYFNLMATFVLGGLWHGAGWTFILWGFLHGSALCIHRVWQRSGFSMPSSLGLVTTFLFVNFAWVFFRADDVSSALHILGAMVGAGSLGDVSGYIDALHYILGMSGPWSSSELMAKLAVFKVAASLVVFILIAVFARNSLEIGLGKSRFTALDVVIVSVSLMLAILLGIATRAPTFLYFNF